MDKTIFIAIICTVSAVGVAFCIRTIVKAMDGKQRLDFARIEAAHTLAEYRRLRGGR